jgi:hypothetical protein
MPKKPKTRITPELHKLLVALGREGGLKSGKARMTNFTAAERTEIARAAARARWKKHEKQG